MALKGELAGWNGATCSCCGRRLDLQVCKSAAAYYLGYFCPECGPYSRESEYFEDEQTAQLALEWHYITGDPINSRASS